LSGLVIPKFHELEIRTAANTNAYHLHCKNIPFLSKQPLIDLPSHSPELQEKLRDLMKWTTEAERYAPATSTRPITSSLKHPDIAQQLARRKIQLQRNPKGWCKSFRVPEHAKGRWRAIQDPILANRLTAKDSKVTFTSTHERHAAILKGRWAIDHDWAAFYDQFELSPEVSEYFSFRHEGKTFSMRVLPMGLKHSVSVAHTATLQLLNFAPRSFVEAYIDNVRLISDDKQQTIRDAATLLCRCAAAGVTVNEVDVNELLGLSPDAMMARAVELLTPLCKQQGSWLGEDFDYEEKLISISARTREKVARCLDTGLPSFRAFAGAVGILQYASRTLDLPLAKYFSARRAISSVAWLLEQDDRLWDQPMPSLCPDVMRNLRAWRTDLLEAPPA
jgi:hypothetical protein